MGNKPTTLYKAISGYEDYHPCFAADSTDRIYITSLRRRTVICDPPYKELDYLRWSGLAIHARQLICERVESFILQVVFPNLNLSGDDEDCIWALFGDHIGLYHIETDTLKLLNSPGIGSPDTADKAKGGSPDWILPETAPSYSLMVSYATKFLRWQSSMIILGQDANIRILDLKTWTLRTLAQLEASTHPHAYSFYPTIVSTGAIPFIASEHYITLDHATGALRMDLRTGETCKLPKLSLLGQTCDCILPIPSARNTLAYLVRNGGASHLVRIVNGKMERVPLEIGRGQHAAHIASIGFTLKTRTIETIGTVITAREETWELLEAAPAPNRLKTFDLSSLINNDLFNLEITIGDGSESGEWKLPLDIVTDLYPSFNGRELNKLIKPFPSSTVHALVGRMFGKPLPNAICVDSCRIWSHVIYLWRAVDAENNFPLFNFIYSLVPQLPSPVACNLLLDMWNDEKTSWTLDDPIMIHLAWQVKIFGEIHFSELLATHNSDRNIALGLAIKGLPKARRYSAQENRLVVKPVAEPLSFKLLSRLEKPTDFMFIVPTPKTVRNALVGGMRYLYTRWMWFKRLMDFGGEEKKNRTAKMPAWMSMSLLRAVLGHIHEEWFDEALAVSDALALLEHRQEFDICDADDKPVAPFVALYDHCMAVVFHEVSRDNILEQLANYQHLGMKPKVMELLALIASGHFKFRVDELVKPLSLELWSLLVSEVALLRQ